MDPDCRPAPLHAGSRRPLPRPPPSPAARERSGFGAAAAACLIDDVFPAVDVVAVDAGLHEEAVRDFRRAIESAVSLVDRTSFAFMRREGIDEAIALDADFQTAGFITRP